MMHNVKQPTSADVVEAIDHLAKLFLANAFNIASMNCLHCIDINDL
jgi:hypothetical protein